ncbi:MAG: protein kinase [Chloroflexaceae bacterium]|nr:protein kinase [Chloroflexaceae bacterium]
MKKVCLACERTSFDSNLYCQEPYCPAERSPNVLDYGEWLGDIEILKPLIVLRSSVLYEARRQKQMILLKVAHPGLENTRRLEREAIFLRSIRNPYLPVLLPPYTDAALKDHAYGKAMLREHLLYFCLFEHFEGKPLRYMLNQNPQLWVRHIGWLMINLASAVAFLQSKGMLHYGISPDTVLVRFDTNPDVPRILLFDLGMVSTFQDFRANWHPFFVPPAYTAPELMNLRTFQPNYATDVYGLGLTLYELLVGEPAFPFKLRSDHDIAQAVRQNRRVRMNRIEDVKPIAEVALQAVHPDESVRQKTAIEVVGQMQAYFGAVPPKKKGPGPNLKMFMIVTVVFLALAFGITIVFTVSEIWASFASDSARNVSPGWEVARLLSER